MTPAPIQTPRRFRNKKQGSMSCTKKSHSFQTVILSVAKDLRIRWGRHKFPNGSGRLSTASSGFLRKEQGSSLVEFAFSFTILLAMMYGIIDMSRALYINHYVAYASRQAARYAMVRGATWSGTSCAATTTYDCDATGPNVQSYVQSQVPPGVSATKVTATTSWTGLTAAGGGCVSIAASNSPGCSVQVTVTYPFHFILPYLPATAITFTSSSSVTISQ
jgi:Flp pilus assembly protein TadG